VTAGLRGLPLFHHVPEIRCQFAIVIGKHLKESPLGPFIGLPRPLFALGGLGLILLEFGLKISPHGATPRKPHNPRSYAGMHPVRKDGDGKEISQRRDTDAP
jgi:hypothetical protein